MAAKKKKAAKKKATKKKAVRKRTAKQPATPQGTSSFGVGGESKIDLDRYGYSEEDVEEQDFEDPPF